MEPFGYAPSAATSRLRRAVSILLISEISLNVASASLGGTYFRRTANIKKVSVSISEPFAMATKFA
jgi:hypothetical protein